MEVVYILTALLALLLLRTPVAVTLGVLGCILLVLKEFSLSAVPQRLYGTMDSFELLAVPMFLLMSNILLRGGVGKDLYTAVHSWVGHWPGGLGVATTLSCTLFSAISGSSVATAATIGTVAIPEMTSRGYERSFVFGLLAAGGTLGILIPPSIPLILYATLVENTSTPKLFLAGIGPGLFLATLFILYSLIYSKLKGNYIAEKKSSWTERLHATLKALPVLLLSVLVIGSIYTGVATPSESAALGFILALIITFAMGRMNWKELKEATYSSLSTTTMIFLIVAGAKVFSYAITIYMIPKEISLLTAGISSAGMFIFAVGLILLLMGFFLESLSMLLVMVPVFLPSLDIMHIDLIWFGIFFMILVETALITPPVGMNLFVIQAVSKARIEEVVQGAWPFVIIMLVTAVLMWFWPALALYIPQNF